MTKLLKDMPEHMERIEGNMHLEQDILSIVDIDKPELDEIIRVFTDHVNQNYTFGGDLAKEYERGFEDGQEDYEENPPINEEKLCTEYVVEKFGECKSFEEFAEIYNGLRNISYTYMR